MQKIIHGDCLEVLRRATPNSIDAIITDPPYELGFMGKSWDSTGIANNVELWKECLRVLKPGGHLLAFSGTRTYHRMASAIEDAGFEVRDMIEWVYGSGFPKSLDIAKQIDKRGGKSVSWFGKWLREWREVNNIRQIEISKLFPSKTGGLTGCVANWELGLNMPTNEQFNLICKTFNLPFESLEEAEREVVGLQKKAMSGWNMDGTTQFKDRDITKGNSEWEGWGTALKPAHEPICMARKPLSEKTVAENVLKYGTGGINIDESRIDSGDSEGLYRKPVPPNKTSVQMNMSKTVGTITDNYLQGRFPANLIHDNSEEVRECFPESGSSARPNCDGKNYGKNTQTLDMKKDTIFLGGFNDSGNSSRFFKSIIDDKNTCNYKQKQHTMNDLYSNNLLWKNTFVDNAERLLKIIQAIIENTAHLNADELQEEKLSRLVKNAERNADLGEIVIALNIVAIKGKQGELVYQEVLNHFLDYMEDYKKCSQILNLVKLVEISDNTDITEITVNLLKSFGSAQSVTEENTHFENLDTDDLKGDWKSLIYQAKASKSDRGEGNNHATVKPTALMEYLIKMVTREGQIVLDPFAGSGTTLLACKNLGRGYVGIEREEEYIKIINARLGNTL